jgi:hypothetical protein
MTTPGLWQDWRTRWPGQVIDSVYTMTYTRLNPCHGRPPQPGVHERQQPGRAHSCPPQRGKALLDLLARFDDDFVAALEQQQQVQLPFQERESL